MSVSKMLFFTRYNRPPQVVFDTGSDSIVDQSQRDLCDINKLYARYTNEGNGIPVNNRPIYGDFTQPFTLQNVFDLRADLEVLYRSLSSSQREKMSFVQFADRLTIGSDDDIRDIFSNSDSNSMGNTLPSSEASASLSVDKTVSSSQDGGNTTDVAK